eukprot:6195295-Pleurochrysis_carterae.AAC.1
MSKLSDHGEMIPTSSTVEPIGPMEALDVAEASVTQLAHFKAIDMVANAKRLNRRLNRHQVDCRIDAVVVTDTLSGQFILAFCSGIEDYPARKLDELPF